MQSVSQENFGLVIAYVLPGFTSLWGISFLSPTVRTWLGAAPAGSPTVSGFLYVTLTSLGIGVLTNCLRRIVIDPLHHISGISKREWSYTALAEKVTAIEFLIANQFRYYQYYGNMLIAVTLAYAAIELSVPTWSWGRIFGVVVLESVLWLGSRDTLQAYYRRLEEVLEIDS